MHLSGWHVDAFGALHDVGVRGLPDGLVVLHGPNASGKSTLLAFLQRTLFGHPHRNHRDVNHYEPLVGGRRGGRLLVTTDATDGTAAAGEHTVERHDGSGVRVVSPDGSVGDATELDQLTGGSDERLFNAVFAFDLDDLRSIDSLSDDAVRDRLFSAGVRGAGRSARAVVERLDEQARALWTPRTRTARLDQVQDEVHALGVQLDQARRLAAAYPERRAEEEACRLELEELEVARTEAEAEERRAATLLAAWPVWQRRRADEEALAELGAVPAVEAGALERHERLDAMIDASRERLALLEADRRRLRERRDDLAVDPALAEVAGEATLLDEECLVQRDRLERLRVLAAERDQLADAHARGLQSLGPDWDDDRVARLDVSIETRGGLRALKQRLERAERERVEARHRADAARLEVEQQRRRVARAREQLEAIDDGDDLPGQAEIESDRERVAALRGALGEARTAEQTLRAARELQERAGPTLPGWAAPAFGVATVGLAAGGVWAALAGATGVLAVLAALALVLLGVAVAVRLVVRDRGDDHDPLVTAHERAQRATTDVAMRAADLGLSSSPTSEEVEARAAELERLQARRMRADQLLDGVAQESAALRDLEAAHGSVSAAADEAADEHARAQAAWRGWCTEHGLDARHDPATVMDLLAAVDHARQRREQLARLDDEIAALRAPADVFTARARRVLGAPTAPPEALVDDVRRLAVDVRHDADRRSERADLSDRLDDLEAQITEESHRLEERRTAQSALLRSVGADDEAGLRTAVHRAQRREQLRARLRQADLDLADHLGGSSTAEKWREELATGDRDGWEAELGQARQRRQRLREDRDRALTLLLEARRRREEVETSEVIAELDRRRQALLTRRDELVHQWRVARVASRLVAATLEGFERERQPQVLARAGAHLAHVTGGELEGLRQQGEQLLVLDRTKGTCTVDVLSRGTAEQLYLCLRLALAEDFAERSPRLPFVMDDVLVNFDPVRCRRLARLLAEVASRAQVLYFTCHPQTVDVLEEAGAAAIYDLPGDGGAPVRRGG